MMDGDDRQFVLWRQQPIQAQSHNHSVEISEAWLRSSQMTSVSVTQEEIHLPIPQLAYFSHDLYCTSNTNSFVNIVTERLAKHLLVDILIGVQSQGFRLRINAEFAT